MEAADQKRAFVVRGRLVKTSAPPRAGDVALNGKPPLVFSGGFFRLSGVASVGLQAGGTAVLVQLVFSIPVAINDCQLAGHVDKRRLRIADRNPIIKLRPISRGASNTLGPQNTTTIPARTPEARNPSFVTPLGQENHGGQIPMPDQGNVGWQKGGGIGAEWTLPSFLAETQ